MEVCFYINMLTIAVLAFRDRNAGSDRNRNKGTEEETRGNGRGGYGARVRGGKWTNDLACGHCIHAKTSQFSTGLAADESRSRLPLPP